MIYIMANVTSGLDALDILNNEGETGSNNKFTPLKSGDSKIVKVINLGDMVTVPTYSIFKKVNTFVPEKPAQLSAKDYPQKDFTPFDKAWKYHNDLKEEFGDYHSQRAGDFRVKRRFAMGFYDLDEEEMIVIDFSRNQAKILNDVIYKNQAKLGRKAFELEKSGSGTSTTVSLNVLDVEEPDLTEKQIKAFKNAPKEFDSEKYEGLFFVRNEEQMIEALEDADFDVTLIGLEPPKKGGNDNNAEDNPFEGQKTYDDVASEDPTDNF